MNGVDDHGAEPIAVVRQGRADRGKVLAIMRAKGAAHVFQHDQARRSIFVAQGFDELPERPEGAGAVALEAGTGAGQGKVLARERGPSQVSAGR
ncbi:hypothetical protein D9M70_630780 [compost metagenome]